MDEIIYLIEIIYFIYLIIYKMEFFNFFVPSNISSISNNSDIFNNFLSINKNINYDYKINDNPLKIILKNNYVPKYEDVYLKYILINPNILNVNNKIKLYFDGNNYKGIFNFENFKFISYAVKEYNAIYISFHKNKNKYLHIMIDKPCLNITYVSCIIYRKKSIKLMFDKLLLKLAIHYLIKNKKKYNIEKVCFIHNNKSFYFNI